MIKFIKFIPYNKSGDIFAENKKCQRVKLQNKTSPKIKSAELKNAEFPNAEN